MTVIHVIKSNEGDEKLNIRLTANITTLGKDALHLNAIKNRNKNLHFSTCLIQTFKQDLYIDVILLLSISEAALVNSTIDSTRNR